MLQPAESPSLTDSWLQLKFGLPHAFSFYLMYGTGIDHALS
jgi:hypothetical protein